MAFLAGTVTKQRCFAGGAVTVAGWEDSSASPDRLGRPPTPRERLAGQAFVEGVVKTVTATLRGRSRTARDRSLRRLARAAGVQRALAGAGPIAPVHLLEGFAAQAKEGAQGAALIADGLAGGSRHDLVRVMGIDTARGTVLDDLYVISRATARRASASPEHGSRAARRCFRPALAESAERAGYLVTAVDAFGDLDL